MKCGTVAIIGRPNVGKSTLVNTLLKSKVAIVSPKPQTTRNAVRCIYNADGIQIIFTDTPGIHLPDNKLGKGLVDAAIDAMDSADAVCYVVEAGDRKISVEDAEIISLLKDVDSPIVLVMNKADKAPKDDSSELYLSELNFSAAVKISARAAKVNKANKITQVAKVAKAAKVTKNTPHTLFQDVQDAEKTSDSLERFISVITQFIPEGEPWYDTDILIDSTERFLASELIREQVLRQLRDEVPHCVAVEIDDYKSPDEFPDRKKLYISARLIVETEGQKRILIGEGGSMIKNLGQGARLEIEKSTGHSVYLELRVQTRPAWRQSQSILKRLGYGA